MALALIVRRSASRIAPLAIRAIGSQQSRYHSLIFNGLNQEAAFSLTRGFGRTTFVSGFRQFSSSSDEKLLRVLESEIKCAEESDDQEVVQEAPEGFPFEIHDNPGEQTISLTREFNGETIKVEVHMPSLVTGEQDDDEDDGDDNNEGANASSIPLVVSICKKRVVCLEFGCTAYADEISIDSLSVKDPESSDDKIPYEGPDFADLDENLQRAFHKYLEIRGIKPSTTNFLHEYMINKDSGEYLQWLKNIKQFIEA
ncbi:Mitochondrial glycoprotein [Dillenia turbinata]|uniref:Mitochondrial glycoprotein n=1 Tax=Dillenia turbinata TaxID=194707 RepID=A0AAN8Z8Z2_9MAGN